MYTSELTESNYETLYNILIRKVLVEGGIDDSLVKTTAYYYYKSLSTITLVYHRDIGVLHRYRCIT